MVDIEGGLVDRTFYIHSIILNIRSNQGSNATLRLNVQQINVASKWLSVLEKEYFSRSRINVFRTTSFTTTLGLNTLYHHIAGPVVLIGQITASYGLKLIKLILQDNPLLHRVIDLL